MNKSDILELIELGFSPKLINLEFGVPIEIMEQYLLEQKNSRDSENTEKTDTVSKKASIADEKMVSKRKPLSRSEKSYLPDKKDYIMVKTVGMKKTRLQVMREKYRKNYFVETEPEERIIKFDFPTPDQEKQVDGIIERLSSKYEKFDTLKFSEEKKKLLLSMFEDIGFISNYPKTLKQLVQISRIFADKKLEGIALNRTSNCDSKLRRVRKDISEELSRCADGRIKGTSDLVELKEIQRNLLLAGVLGKIDFQVDSVRRQLDDRITKLSAQKAIYNLRNNVSLDIQEVIASIANGDFDEQKAKEAIATEAKRKLEAAPKNKFALTQERQERQVVIQIRTILSEQGKKYPIKNPEMALDSLVKLSADLSEENLFRVVVDNLISQGNMEGAKELCEKHIKRRSFDEGETEFSKTARKLKKKIVLTEIGNMVLEQINKVPDVEEDEIFMNVLEERLAIEKLSLAGIVLGRNETDTKSITLADVWYESPTKRR